MSLRLGDTAPDFLAESTQGPIRFHEWASDSWTILFSHPRDFTPVCTTELGYVARLKPEFDRRGVKAIGLSIDPVGSHQSWAADIRETQGHAPNFPIIADPDRKVAGALRDDPPRARRGLHGAHGVRDRSQEEDPADDHVSADDRP